MNLLRPIKLAILCLAGIASRGSVAAQADDNPLLGMIGRQPGEGYFDEYEKLCDSLFSADSLSRVELVRLFAQAGAADPTGEWNLDRRRIESHVRFYESRNGGYTPSEGYTAERFTEDLLEIARTAEKKGFRIIRFHSLFNAATVCRVFAHDYERAFAYYLEAAEGVAEMSLREFPWKFYLYLEIGDFYFSFREYDDAARFYRIIADDPEMVSDRNRLYPALNGLGLCYRYVEDYEKSDSCFRRIIEFASPVDEDRYEWEGIAMGNIGYNCCLRGDYDGALVWMKAALAKMKRPNDYPFTSQLAANIAYIFLERNDIGNGKKFLDIALDYHRRSRLPEKDSRLLEVATRYHALRGDRRETAAGLDSTLRAKEREQEAFSGLVLRRVEQRLRASDLKVHEQRLEAEKMRSRMYRQTVILISGALAVILLLLVLVTVYYRRTRNAYRDLVRESQHWAGLGTARYGYEESPRTEAGNVAADTPKNGGEDSSDIAECTLAGETDCSKMSPESEAFDRTIMDAVEKAVIGGKMFKRPDLTLDMLAAVTGYNKYYLSAALNRCAGVNFNAYINEWRVKEAVLIMSDPANAGLTVDVVAFDAGFNDRKNFYRVFKKVTGLSPTQFRRNISA